MPTTTSNPPQVPVAGSGSTAVATTPKILAFAASTFKLPNLETQAGASGLVFGSTWKGFIQANGYLANLNVRITASGGSGATTPAVASADAPWNVIQSIALMLPGGTKPIIQLSGYQAYLIGWLGGYRKPNPTSLPSYSAVAVSGDFVCSFFIPVEIIARNALGALSNTNGQSLFQLVITFSPAATVYSTEPVPTVPTLAVETHSENYSVPRPQSSTGVQQETAPPLLGTTQFWTSQESSALSGYNAYYSTRVGQAIRNLILVTRDAGVRAALLPNPLQVSLNNTQIYPALTPEWLIDRNAELWGAALPLGVYVLPRDTDLDGAPGQELRNSWIPTTTGDKLAFSGTWTANTTLEVITNDIAPAGDYLQRALL